MEITSATDTHVPEIVEVWKEFMDFHKDIDLRFPMKENAPLIWEKHLRDLIKSEDTLVLVAMDKDHVVGYSISLIESRYPPVFTRETYGFIASMAVQSNYRRKGIGERMLGKIYEWFKSLNIDKIELTVTAQNQIGYSFWKKHGFRDYTHLLYLDKG